MNTLINTTSRTLLADLQTPVGIYLKVRDLYPESALLESSDYHSSENSFSYIGIEPIASFSVMKDKITERLPDGTIHQYDIAPERGVTDTFRDFSKLFDVRGDRPVARNDKIRLEEVAGFDKILLSPGPGIPSESGILLPLIREYAPSKSIFGVCLGEQAIGEAFGAKLENLSEVCHGVATPIRIVSDDPLFAGVESGTALPHPARRGSHSEVHTQGTHDTEPQRIRLYTFS